MVLAIEPMVNAGKPAVRGTRRRLDRGDADKSLSAHFEHTVAVTAGEPWILTAREVPFRPGSNAAGGRAKEVVRRCRRAVAQPLYAVKLDEGGSVTAHIGGGWIGISCGSCRRPRSIELSPVDIGEGGSWRRSVEQSTFDSQACRLLSTVNCHCERELP
jgi:hypothetical protein